MTITTRSFMALAAVSLAAAPAPAQTGGPYDLTWSTIDGGGTMWSTGGVYSLGGTIGQPDAGSLAAANLGCAGGFWSATAASPCYANCDGSTIAPILNVNDFVCFQTKFAQGDPYANCDGSTIPPVLNVNDFICFQTRYAQGCP
jgi:hypothetical protein